MEEDLSNMSLSELRIYLRKLKEDVFPPASHPRKARVVKDIKKLKTITTSSAGMEAVVVARKSMKKPIQFEEVEEEGVLIRKPIEPLPTYELPCHLRRKEKEKAERRAKKTISIEEPPTEIKAPVLPEKPKKEKAISRRTAAGDSVANVGGVAADIGNATKKEVPEVAETATVAPVEEAVPSSHPWLRKLD